MDFHIVSDEDRDEEEYESFAMNGQEKEDSQYGITNKIPPAFDGKTSWFQYEDLIDDWVDLTTLPIENTDQR